MSAGRIGARRLTAVLIALCLALAALVSWEATETIDGEAGAVPNGPESASKPPGATPRWTMSGTLDDFSEIASRPLFVPSRRPSEPVPGDAAEDRGGAASGAITLVGTVVSSGGRLAILQYGTPPRLARLSEGQRLQSWTVQSIAADRVVLRNGDEMRELRFKAKPSPAAGRKPRSATPTDAAPPGGNQSQPE